jgi:hypothetical protein
MEIPQIPAYDPSHANWPGSRDFIMGSTQSLRSQLPRRT